MYKLIDIINKIELHKIFGGSIKIYLDDLKYFKYSDIIFKDKQVVLYDDYIILYGEIDFLQDIRFYGYAENYKSNMKFKILNCKKNFEDFKILLDKIK